MKIELRSNEIVLEGYVNAVARDSKVIKDKKGNSIVEQIEPGAFTRALNRNNEVELMFNHKKVIGGQKLGNLELIEDNIGLKAKCTVTDSEVIKRAKANKLKGWSFGFVCKKEKYEEMKNGLKRRIIQELELLEVSILDIIPAYEGTSIEQRGKEMKNVIKEIRSYEETENTINGFIKDLVNGDSGKIVSSDEKVILKNRLEKRVPLIELLSYIGNFTEELIAKSIIYSVSEDGENLIIDDVIPVETKKEQIKLTDIYELVVESDGMNFIEKALEDKIILDIEKRIRVLLNSVKNEVNISKANFSTEFIELINSIPRALRRDLVITGDMGAIATLRDAYIKSGHNSYDIFGISPVIQNGIDGLYLISLAHLFINYLAKEVEFRKKLDTYDFKLNTYGHEQISNNEAVKRINLV